jgi:hypothetical protein
VVSNHIYQMFLGVPLLGTGMPLMRWHAQEPSEHNVYLRPKSITLKNYRSTKFGWDKVLTKTMFE